MSFERLTAGLFFYGLSVLTAGCVFAQEPVLSSFTITGSSAVSGSEIIEAAGLVPGALWNQETSSLSRDIIASLYHSRGYMESRVFMTELTPGPSVQISVDITEGPRYMFGDTGVHGLEKLSEKTICKELSYKPGDPYSQQALLDSQSRLYATGWFESLSTSVSSSPRGASMEVDLQAREKPMKWVKGGVGYGSEEKERFSLGLTHNNFLQRGYKLELQGLLSRIWLEYRADFTNRHFMDSLTELRNSSAWRRELREGYKMESLKNTLSLGRRLAKNIYGSVQYRLQRTLIYKVDPGISAETPSVSRIRSAGFSLNRDTTDDFFYPSRGFRSELSLERSGGFWGGDINIYKASLKNTIYVRLLPGLTGLFSARGAFVHETGSTEEVPIYERLFTGGANSIRGYPERGVGPTDSDGNQVGGKTLLGANAELRFPLYKKLRGAFFVDGGQVASSLSGSAPSNWRYGAGAGLRYRTPVGPIRADFGYKLNPDKPVNPELWRLHLSIGEAF